MILVYRMDVHLIGTHKFTTVHRLQQQWIVKYIIVAVHSLIAIVQVSCFIYSVIVLLNSI